MKHVRQRVSPASAPAWAAARVNAGRRRKDVLFFDRCPRCRLNRQLWDSHRYALIIVTSQCAATPNSSAMRALSNAGNWRAVRPIANLPRSYRENSEYSCCRASVSAADRGLFRATKLNGVLSATDQARPAVEPLEQ